MSVILLLLASVCAVACGRTKRFDPLCWFVGVVCAVGLVLSLLVQGVSLARLVSALLFLLALSLLGGGKGAGE